MTEAELLGKILGTVESMNSKLDAFIKMRGFPLRIGSGVVLDAMALFDLPDHLRKSVLAVLRNGRVTAGGVASQTKRARAVESGYLNTLCTMGFLKKERLGRKTFFLVNSEGA